MDVRFKLLDVVALTQDLPASELNRGHVGTIVEVLGDPLFEVEFSDDRGRTYAMAAIRADQMMPLHHGPGRLAS